jgi:Photosynthetic reaction centre cytochrome C subunit
MQWSFLGRHTVAAILLTLSGMALAQPGQEAPENLQVLPKDWTRPQVINVMQAFTAALGVGCNYCHVMNQGTPPDFASDDKDEKEKARAMMRITGELNTKLPTDFGVAANELTRVQCITCHRGVPEPKQLAEILAKTSAEKGFAAASAQYSELKSKYYGAQAYDFSETGLIATARPLVRSRTDEALQFLRMNLELFPRSAESYIVMAQAQQVKNDKAGAIASLERALELDPMNGQARRALDELRR